MTTTKNDVDELRRKELKTPELRPRPNFPGADEIDHRVDRETRAQYREWREMGEKVLNNAADRMETDHAFASREGLARAQFEGRAAERHATDVFNGFSDEPNRAEHELLVAEDRLASAVDDYLDPFENPELEVTPEIVREVENLNQDVQVAEQWYDATRNNGLPLDPPLDVDRERYIRETTSREDDLRGLSREQYIEQTTQPSHGVPRDRTHSR